MTYTRTILLYMYYYVPGTGTWYGTYVNYQTLVRVVWYSRAVQYMYCNTWYE